MQTPAMINGWQRLSNGFDVEFKHNIPYRVSDNGKDMSIPAPLLLEEISVLGKLHVQLGEWHAGEYPDEHEARLYVSGGEIDEVLRRLAVSAAAVFIDRYHKPIDDSDVDWDRLEYLKDFCAALDHCGLEDDQVDPVVHRDSYIDNMHRESRRLAGSTEQPLVEPE